jgi:hypothetical protein
MLNVLKDPTIPLKSPGYLRKALHTPSGLLTPRGGILTDRDKIAQERIPEGVTANFVIGYVDRLAYHSPCKDWAPELKIYVYSIWDDFRQDAGAYSAFMEAYQQTPNYDPAIFVLKDFSLPTLTHIRKFWGETIGDSGAWDNAGYYGIPTNKHPLCAFNEYLEQLRQKEVSFVSESRDTKRTPQILALAEVLTEDISEWVSLSDWTIESFVESPIQLTLEHIPLLQAKARQQDAPFLQDDGSVFARFLQHTQEKAADTKTLAEYKEELKTMTETRYNALKAYVTHLSAQNRLTALMGRLSMTPEKATTLLAKDRDLKDVLELLVWAELGMEEELSNY